MADLKEVTYCGLYCGLCSQKNRTPKQAAALRDTMRKDAWEYFGPNIEGFTDFWSFLDRLAEGSSNCCREGNCGAPFCSIRKCAREKGVDVCVFCAEYPCRRIKSIAKGYPTLLADGQRIKAIGMDAWIAEQQERAKTGFAYADIRCHPYEVPND
ncbi:MAG: DUF3795 domain-containing protein [Sedimentisphaerales bacterium]|nr:DUF3795 domain-containing protein [Sedimentisphaerales bacterium]